MSFHLTLEWKCDFYFGQKEYLQQSLLIFEIMSIDWRDLDVSISVFP